MTGPLPHRPDPAKAACRAARSLWLHLGLYLGLLIAFVSWQPLDITWSVDEGLYALQVESLERGAWQFEYWAESIDPAGRWFPLANIERQGDRFFPYVRSPAYPLLLQATSKVFGRPMGLHVAALLGALAAAAAAWLLTTLVDRKIAPAAFWICALGPVLMNAHVIWAHAPSAGVGGLTAYLSVRAWQAGPTAGRLALLAAGAAGGVLLRTEGLLFAAAIAAVLGLLSAARLVRRSPHAWRGFVLAGVVGTAAVTANMLEQRWVESIVGGYATNDYIRGDGIPYWEGRLQGARHILWQGTVVNPSRAAIGVATLAALVAALALRLRTEKGRRIAIMAMVVSAAGMALQFVDYTRDTVPGILAAWPLALVGLIVWRLRGSTQVERILVAVAGLHVAATLATQYPGGGGAEWGARYLSPLYPLLAVLVALGLWRVVYASPGRGRRPLVGALVLVAVTPAVCGLGAAVAIRAHNDDRVAEVEAHHGVVLTDQAFRAQAAFRTFPERRWLKVPPAEVPVALERLAQAAFNDVLVLVPLADWADDPSELPAGYRIERELGEDGDRGVLLSRTGGS